MEYARDHDNFYINDINYQSAVYGLDAWSDPFYWHMYKYSLNLNAIPWLAHNIANIVKSVYGKNKKSLVLDLVTPCGEVLLVTRAQKIWI